MGSGLAFCVFPLFFSPSLSLSLPNPSLLPPDDRDHDNNNNNNEGDLVNTIDNNNNIVNTTYSNSGKSYHYTVNGNGYSFPLKRDEFMLVTSQFGMRKDPVDSSKQQMHKGIDINLHKGDAVVAAFDGMVRIASIKGGYGNVIIIRHYNGLETVYGHLSKIKVKLLKRIYSHSLMRWMTL